jgi:anti-sigma factor RsiW
MNGCGEASWRLPDLLGGGLDPETEAGILAHLAGCPDCRKELAFWAAVRAAQSELAPPPPEAVRAAIGAALRREMRTDAATEAAESVRDAWALMRKAVRLGLQCARSAVIAEGA